ncbi:alpha/beta-hydrolase, partial [Zopfia rhizophila CBS 207.26]
MNSLLKIAAICALIWTVAIAAPSNGYNVQSSKRRNASDLIVDLKYAIYQGIKNESTGLNLWKGIRYAAPPIGDLRWKAPQTPAANRTVTPASNFGPICPQAYPSIPNAPFIPGNEDCLFLNVYAPPNAPSSGLPVLVWIHGGGYGFGDGTQDMTEIINANGKGFVAVAIQYRLGAFGFLSSNEIKANGALNAGILDQAFALGWVQKYIHLFGGDSKKVTISGESAGGGSVMLHTIAKGGTLGTSLFLNGIAASPYLPAQYDYNKTIPTQHYYDFSSKAGCGEQGAVLECLKSKDSMVLQRANSNVSTSGTYGTWAFLPVTDGVYLQAPPSVQLNAKKVNGAKILVGNNANEGPLFVPPTIKTLDDLKSWLKQEFPTFADADIQKVLDAYPSSDAPVDPSALKFATDGSGPATAVNVSQVATGQQQRGNNIYAEATFICPSYWLNNAYSPSNSYHYQYSVPFASHIDDISAYFGPSAPNQSPEFSVAFRQIWGNFITKGNPSIASEPAAANWPVWVGGEESRMVNLNETGGTPYQAVTQFGASVTQFMNPGLKNNITTANAYSWEGGRGARCEFWKDIAAKVPM